MEEEQTQPALDQSNVVQMGSNAPPTNDSYADYETRKWCLINAGSLVVNMQGYGVPQDVLGLARGFYLFLVSEDPLVDPEFYAGNDEPNVVNFQEYKDKLH